MRENERNARITMILDCIAGHEAILNTYSDIYKYHKHSISEYEKELVELRSYQHYTPEDFPRLDSCDNNITFHDGTYEYIIKKESRTSRVNVHGDYGWVDENVEIEECKLSDIQEGDYFAIFDPFPVQYMANYRYCTKVEDDNLDYDYGEKGYVMSGCMYKGKDENVTYKIVKFIPRNLLCL